MSMHGKDWAKLLGGAALLATGFGAAGLGPLAGLFSAAEGAGAAGAAGGITGALASGAAPTTATLGEIGTGASAGGWGALLGKGATTAGTTAMGSAFSPRSEMRGTSFGQIPQLNSQQSDPFEILQRIAAMKKGGLG